MWQKNQASYATAHGLTLRQAARLQATAEHLVPRQNGGGHGANIVAACHHCNQYRHKHKPSAAADADRYRTHVKRQVERQRWHARDIMRALQRCAPEDARAVSLG